MGTRIRTKNQPAGSPPDQVAYTRVDNTSVEGKNRGIVEALCSDVPVLALSEFNRAARGNQSLLPQKSGLTVGSSGDEVADGIATIVANYADFRAREEYLKIGGRLKFFWEYVHSFAYFRTRLPHASISENEVWLDERVRATYGVGLREVLYYSSGNSAHAKSRAVCLI